MVEEKRLITFFKSSLKDTAFRHMDQALKRGKMGAFILLSCFIDHLATYYFGKDSSKSNYKAFVKEFLPDYDPDKLYRDLRCPLVRNYTEGGCYLFTDGEKAGNHLSQINGKTLINLENFIADIEAAMNKYFGRLDEEKDLRKKAIDRLRQLGFE